MSCIFDNNTIMLQLCYNQLMFNVIVGLVSNIRHCDCTIECIKIHVCHYELSAPFNRGLFCIAFYHL